MFQIDPVRHMRFPENEENIMSQVVENTISDAIIRNFAESGKMGM